MQRLPEIEYTKLTSDSNWPACANRRKVVDFFFETMQPWNDKPEDIEKGLDYAFSSEAGKGGFLMLAAQEGRLVGALLMLNTGMGGYIPENLLLFVSVAPSIRGQGLGRKLIERAMSECRGSIKLHVDYDNPAKRLYERLGFLNKYAEMRLIR